MFVSQPLLLLRHKEAASSWSQSWASWLHPPSHPHAQKHTHTAAITLFSFYRVHEVSPAKKQLMFAVLALMASIAFVATAGSIESIIMTASKFQIFQSP